MKDERKDNDRDGQSMRRVYWCTAASSWRVNLGKGQVKSFYVARSPANTYKDRVSETQQQAIEFLNASRPA